MNNKAVIDFLNLEIMNQKTGMMACCKEKINTFTVQWLEKSDSRLCRARSVRN